MDISYDYEYADESSTLVEEGLKSKNLSKFKSDMEFTLSSDLDGIVGDRKTELVELLKADHDDLMIINTLKKTSCSNSNVRVRVPVQPVVIHFSLILSSHEN